MLPEAPHILLIAVRVDGGLFIHYPHPTKHIEHDHGPTKNEKEPFHPQLLQQQQAHPSGSARPPHQSARCFESLLCDFVQTVI